MLDDSDMNLALSKVLRGCCRIEGIQEPREHAAAFAYWIVPDNGGHYCEFWTPWDIASRVWIPLKTDWLPFPFTMNWMFTRPGRVRFEKGEPFCFITLVQDRALAQVQPVTKSLTANTDLRKQYDAWYTQRSEFNARLMKQEPEAVRDAWQRYYFKGELPDNTGPAPAGHTNKRRLKSPKLGV